MGTSVRVLFGVIGDLISIVVFALLVVLGLCVVGALTLVDLADVWVNGWEGSGRADHR